jgi:ABC-type antimicrobial peptide transport system permease subunit
MALGANGADVMRHVLWQAMRPVLIGGLAGVALCAGISQVLSSMLFGLSAYDLTAFVCVPLFLLAVGLLSSCLPARRALRVDLGVRRIIKKIIIS